MAVSHLLLCKSVDFEHLEPQRTQEANTNGPDCGTTPATRLFWHMDGGRDEHHVRLIRCSMNVMKRPCEECFKKRMIMTMSLPEGSEMMMFI